MCIKMPLFYNDRLRWKKEKINLMLIISNLDIKSFQIKLKWELARFTPILAWLLYKYNLLFIDLPWQMSSNILQVLVSLL